MNGIHDMGGMHGFGPVTPEENEPLFHAAWEERMHAITYGVVLAHLFNVDQFRYGIEQMPPAAYLRASYFERWLATVEHNLAANGYIAAGEVDARLDALRGQAEAELPGEAHSAMLPLPPAPAAPLAPPASPRFAIGETVQARNVHPSHHTRLPRYVRGKRGVVILMPGASVFPDTRALGLAAQQQHLYTVRFNAAELWGDGAERNQTVSIDIWEQYLEAA